jgi:hypothetical protein
MTEVPKIVYDRLRAVLPERALSDVAAREQAHPDADLLTAFAEQALSATERDGVLKHLALCEDCREVLVLALPGVDAVSAPIAAEAEFSTGSIKVTRVSTKVQKSWLTMLAHPSMRWAALAAGVVVAASILLVHPGKLNQPISPFVHHQATPTATLPAAGSPIASLPTDQVVTKAINDTRSSSGPLLSKNQFSKNPKAERALAPVHQAESGMLLADNRSNSGLAENPSAAPIISRASTETVEISGHDAPAIQKAKPALQEPEATEAAQAQAANVQQKNEQQKNQAVSDLAFAKKQEFPASQTLARNVNWAITAGTLQRSLDNGQNWQNALHADHPLLCYASHSYASQGYATHGEEVWTGGQAGTLFHSIDSGVTWVQVHPSIKGQQLTSDVTHIDIDIHGDVRGPAQIGISTSNNEVWTSADGGNTWQKN